MRQPSAPAVEEVIESTMEAGLVARLEALS